MPRSQALKAAASLSSQIPPNVGADVEGDWITNKKRRGWKAQSQADIFDRWPSSDALERRSFFQRRAAFLLRSVPEFLPRASSDFVIAAARTPDNATIEILWGEVPGFTSAH